MLTHARIWAAIDLLAEQSGMSPSGLAKRAGLDPTSFNKSKRRSADGRLRWPSTESISKIIAATGTNFKSFTALVEANPAQGRVEYHQTRSVPLMGFAKAGAGGFFDDAGFPSGQGWDSIDLPAAGREGTYALEVQGDSMLPLYRNGDVLIVDPSAALKRGDRVVAKTVDGEVMAKILQRKTGSYIELLSLNPEHPMRKFAPSDLEWVARVIWASQ